MIRDVNACSMYRQLRAAAVMAILRMQPGNGPREFFAFTKVKNAFPSERAIILRHRTEEYSSSIPVVLYSCNINLLDATRNALMLIYKYINNMFMYM